MEVQPPHHSIRKNPENRDCGKAGAAGAASVRAVARVSARVNVGPAVAATRRVRNRMRGSRNGGSILPEPGRGN